MADDLPNITKDEASLATIAERVDNGLDRATKQVLIHNKVAGPICELIVKPVLMAEGSAADVMVLLESINVGVLGIVKRLGGDVSMFDQMTKQVKSRVANS